MTRHIFFVVFLVVACTAAAVGSFEDALSTVQGEDYLLVAHREDSSFEDGEQNL